MGGLKQTHPPELGSILGNLTEKPPILLLQSFRAFLFSTPFVGPLKVLNLKVGVPENHLSAGADTLRVSIFCSNYRFQIDIARSFRG